MSSLFLRSASHTRTPLPA